MPSANASIGGDIARVVSILDQRIETIQNIRDQLVHEFREARPRLTGDATRKHAITEFIREHGGSATRAEIIEGTGFPVGTVATTLNDKTRFVNRSGRWIIVGDA